jgi:hypothetical protein
MYPNDAGRPGIVLSFLGDKFYGSVARYPNRYSDKQIVYRATGDSHEDVLNKLMNYVVDAQLNTLNLAVAMGKL